MMIARTVKMIAVLLIMAALTLALADRAHASQDVECVLTISVNHGGTPISDLRLTVNEKRLGLEYQCKTNAAGQAVATLHWPQDQVPTKAWVTVTQYYEKSLESGSAIDTLNRYKTAIEQHHFEPYYEVNIPAAGGPASLSIVADDAIKVTGQLPASYPASTEAMAFSHQCAMQLMGEFGKPFVVRGLKKGVPALIGVSPIGQPEVKLITLTATQTAQNVDLGDVEVPDWEGTNIVRLTITDWMSLKDERPEGSDTVSLISSDASRAFVYDFDRNGRVWRQRQHRTEVALPAGKYYVVPGLVGANVKAGAVFGVIRQGGTAADTLGVPSIQVTDGGTNEFTITAQAILTAARSAPAYP
jgi:hypothetical protein